MSVDAGPRQEGAALLEEDVRHGGPSVPWETLLEVGERCLSRHELAAVLVERGFAGSDAGALTMIDGALARGEVAMDGQLVHAVSRQSNLNKSVNAATAEIPASDSDGQPRAREVAEKVQEFAAEYPLRATTPLAESDGTKLRRDYADLEYETWVEEQPDAPAFEVKNPAEGREVTDVSAVEWGEAVRRFLESHARTEKTQINLRKGQPQDAGFESFSIQAENRWMASYQKKYFAQLDAWLRELCGGERPSGGETLASFDDPHIALITRSASSTPEGERVGPVEHATALRDSWEPVYHTLRNTLRAEGYELGESWQYDRRLEPHTGKRGTQGTNEAYAHEHIILAVDGDISVDDLRPVIEKHVEECEWAGADAHGEEAIEVREPDELTDVAAYVADYCSIDPVELWERGPAYVGWAAAMTAGNVRTVSRSEAARAAAKADACKQRCESEESEQSVDHGEDVRRSGRSGYCVECAECGSPHGIDQEQTLTAHRTGPSGPVMADGGVEVPDREAGLRERWQDADAAAVVGESIERTAQREAVRGWLESGESLGRYWAREVEDVRPPGDIEQLVAEVRHPEYDPGEVVGFDDSVPEWHVHSVTVDGEEHRASSGNGVEMVEVTNVRERMRGVVEAGQRYRCSCGTAAYGVTMAAHAGYHGIEEPEIFAEMIEEEEV